MRTMVLSLRPMSGRFPLVLGHAMLAITAVTFGGVFHMASATLIRPAATDESVHALTSRPVASTRVRVARGRAWTKVPGRT